MKSLYCALLTILFSANVFSQDKDASRNPETEKALLGLWGTEIVAGPKLSGELTIDLRQKSGEASIGGYRVPVVFTKDSLRFLLPDGHGEYRGYLEKSSSKIIGHWIQPKGVGFYSYPRASPVELSLLEKNVWRGEVVPLDEKFVYYISFQHAAGDTLTAFFKDPMANLFRNRLFTVSVKEDSVFFCSPRISFSASFDAENAVLYVPLLDNLPPLAFTKKDEQNAVGFYPSVPFGKTSFLYRKPIAEDDGWPVGTLEGAGLNEAPLAEFINAIRSSAPSPTNAMNIHSLLIARHGKLVLEEYFYGFSKEQPHDLRSASKTYSPLMVGIALQQGYPLNIDSPVHTHFPEYKPFAFPDERKNRITLRHLITMRSGLDSRGKYSEDEMYDQTAQPDWYKFTWDMPVWKEPGGDSAWYSSADINLAAGVVRKVTGQWIPQSFYEHFARPLQIRHYHMNLMPTGEGYMGGGLYIRPRDQIKLGQLYLDGGRWKGKQIIPKWWADTSFQLHALFRPAFDRDAGHNYGFGWHLRDIQVAGKDYRLLWMGGNGGQMTIVIPALDMVIGMNGGDYGELRKFFLWEIDYVPKYIISAAKP